MTLLPVSRSNGVSLQFPSDVGQSHMVTYSVIPSEAAQRAAQSRDLFFVGGA